MAKHTTVVLLALLLLVATVASARPGPAIPNNTQLNKGFKEDQVNNEGCEGVGEEECLMRRTLVAHTDYIYTQEKHH